MMINPLEANIISSISMKVNHRAGSTEVIDINPER
jgi:hypothetical protein